MTPPPTDGRPDSVRRPAGALLAAAAALILTVTGCGRDDAVSSEPPRPRAHPTSGGECNDLPLVGNDGGLVLGTDWSADAHPYDRLIPLTVCVTPTSGGGTIRAQASNPRVTVLPRAQPIPTSGNGLLTVQVRVAAGTPSGTQLRLVQDGGLVGDTAGPSILTTPSGWHFTDH